MFKKQRGEIASSLLILIGAVVLTGGILAVSQAVKTGTQFLPQAAQRQTTATGSISVNPTSAEAEPFGASSWRCLYTINWNVNPSSTPVYITYDSSSDNTGEFELCRGTLCSETYGNSIPTVAYIISTIRTIDWRLYDVATNQLISGPARFTCTYAGGLTPTPTPATSFSISGHISSPGGADIVGARIELHTAGPTPSAIVSSLSSERSTSAFLAVTNTGVNGNYQFTGISPGSYEVWPNDPFYTFSPIFRVFTITNSNISLQNFTATTVIPPTLTPSPTPLSTNTPTPPPATNTPTPTNFIQVNPASATAQNVNGTLTCNYQVTWNVSPPYPQTNFDIFNRINSNPWSFYCDAPNCQNPILKTLTLTAAEAQKTERWYIGDHLSAAVIAQSSPFTCNAPSTPTCPRGNFGNLNCSADGCIDQFDLDIFGPLFGRSIPTSMPSGQFTPNLFNDSSTRIDTADYEIMRQNWGSCN